MGVVTEPWMDALVGKVVGKYRLDRVIGAGGMAAVFEATHATVWRKVAIKILSPEEVDAPNAMARFHQEARAAASVGRRGVVDVLDFDQDPNVGPYLAMEFLQGESLATRLEREKRLTARASVELALALLDTLSAVHERDIIHRDLKPANIFYARDEDREVVKILDFGISRMKNQSGRAMTQPGVVLGTPRYMAPEQAAAVSSIDHRVDLYAVGAILYACLAGRPPYDGTDFSEVLAKLHQGPPEPLRARCLGLPEELYSIIECAMARKPTARFSDARAFHRALSDCLATAPTVLTELAAPRPIARSVLPTGAPTRAMPLRPKSVEPEEPLPALPRSRPVGLYAAGVLFALVLGALLALAFSRS